MENKNDLLRRLTERGKELDRGRVIERGREYQIRGAEGRHYILHVVCGTQSFHPEDVQRRYCGYCREFLASGRRYWGNGNVQSSVVDCLTRSGSRILLLVGMCRRNGKRSSLLGGG